MRFVIASVFLTSLVAAEIENFALWKSSELSQRDQALSKKVGPDHSARETLADYKNHRFRMIYRDADGYPEQHDNIVDVVMVQSGEGTLQLGGKMIKQEASNGKGEWKGERLDGGERYPLKAGDVAHIPHKIPHAFLVPKGRHITYVLLKLPPQ